MKDIQHEREKTRAAVVQIMCWCIVVALHQRMGIGGARITRLSEEVYKLQQVVDGDIQRQGRKKAMQNMADKLVGVCDTAVQLPKNRAPKNRLEEQLYMAGNEAATLGWLLFATSTRKVFGYGHDRLERLKKEAELNYAQFNEWYKEDRDWAFEKLRHCVEEALGEPVRVVDEPDEPPQYRVRTPITQEEIDKVVQQVKAKQARAALPAGLSALYSQEEMARRIAAIQGQR